MKSIFTIFLDIEKLIYKVLMWFILVPKTLVQITLNPAWAPGYVKDELENDETPFDEYISPIILLLVVALIPAVAFNFLPSYSATISSPAETQPTTDRSLVFESRADFRSASEEMEYFQVWSVTREGEQPPPVVQSDGIVTQVSGELLVFAPEIHYPGSQNKPITEVDDNTVRDTFIFTFPEPGNYTVSVTAGKYDPKRYNPETGKGIATEAYRASLTVNIPTKTDETITITNEGSTQLPEETQAQGYQSFSSQVQTENTLLLALALMIPPLLFALVTKLFTENIGEETLKENFYTQCYYFSPLSLAIWASYYAKHFVTSDAYFYASDNVTVQIIWLPPVLAALWFIRAESKTIENARGTTGLRSVSITLACIAALLFVAYISFNIALFQDAVRLSAIRIFPILSSAMIASFGVAWYRRRRARNAKVTPGNLFWMGVNGVVLVVLLNFVAVQFAPNTQLQFAPPTEVVSIPATEIVSTPTPQIVIVNNTPVTLPTPTEVVASPTPNPFFVEDFNTDLPTWFDFMTSGDTRLREWRIENGVLAVQLFKRENEFPRFYLVNDSFSYSDVKIDAVVTNRGNNTNGVGLICRYSDIGWYEVLVSNSQTYSLYIVDNFGIVSQGYTKIAEGTAKEIASGPSTNKYTLVCEGNAIRLFVNDVLLLEHTEEVYKYTEGKIGLSVWSPEGLPVIVNIESVEVSPP